jgi:hypothetical protein
MANTPETQIQLVSSHGMLAILEVLEGKCSRDVIMKLLQIINLVRDVCSNEGFTAYQVIPARYCRSRIFREFLFNWVSRSHIPAVVGAD